MKIINYLFAVLFCSLLFSSCGKVKDIAYLQGDDLFKRMDVSDSVEIKIRKNDILDISVSCAEPELLQPFNNLSWGNNYSGNYGAGYNNRGYLVEQDGTINFPLLGRLKIQGLTRRQLIELIQDKLKKGDNLILAAFGAGFTWGAIYLKWGYNGKQA